MILTIRHLSGSLSGKSQRVALQEGQALRLGRGAESDIKFSDAGDDSVSTLHAELSLEEGRLYLEDKRSSNGTFLNGAQCPPFQKVAIPDGSRIRLAKAGPEMQVTAEPARASAAPASTAASTGAVATTGTAVQPKESVGRGTLLREIDRARQEERDVMAGEVAKAKKSTGAWLGIGLALVLLLAGGGIGGAIWWNHDRAAKDKAEFDKKIADRDAMTAKEKGRWEEIQRSVSPSVAHIRCTYRLRVPIPVDSRSSIVVEARGSGLGGSVQGSGVLIRPGLILTALHVVQPWRVALRDWEKLEEQGVTADYDLLDVQYPGQQPIVATVVAGSPQHDLALLQVQTTTATPVRMGRANSDVKVTDRIAIVGYPGDLGQYFVPVRNLAGFGAQVRALTEVIPTFLQGSVAQPLTATGETSHYIVFDASIEPGNSGGPVLNENGELIGIVSQQFQRAGQPVRILGQEFPTLLPMESGSMAVSPDDINEFLRKHGIL
jgi:S1-C subfamily serine protease